MATLQTLYQFERYFEDAAQAFLETATGWDVFLSASDEAFVTPRVEIEFVSMEATEPIDAPISLGLVEFRKYDASFAFRVITDPTAGQTRANHMDAVGACRVACLSSEPNWDASTLPNYGLKYIRQVGTTRSVAGDFQVTQVDYEIKFSIRSGVFPTTTTTTTTTAAP